MSAYIVPDLRGVPDHVTPPPARQSTQDFVRSQKKSETRSPSGSRWPWSEWRQTHPVGLLCAVLLRDARHKWYKRNPFTILSHHVTHVISTRSYWSSSHLRFPSPMKRAPDVSPNVILVLCEAALRTCTPVDHTTMHDRLQLDVWCRHTNSTSDMTTLIALLPPLSRWSNKSLFGREVVNRFSSSFLFFPPTSSTDVRILLTTFLDVHSGVGVLLCWVLVRSWLLDCSSTLLFKWRGSFKMSSSSPSSHSTDHLSPSSSQTTLHFKVVCHPRVLYLPSIRSPILIPTPRHREILPPLPVWSRLLSFIWLPSKPTWHTSLTSSPSSHSTTHLPVSPSEVLCLSSALCLSPTVCSELMMWWSSPLCEYMKDSGVLSCWVSNLGITGSTETRRGSSVCCGWGSCVRIRIHGRSKTCASGQGLCVTSVTWSVMSASTSCLSRVRSFNIDTLSVETPFHGTVRTWEEDWERLWNDSDRDGRSVQMYASKSLNKKLSPQKKGGPAVERGSPSPFYLSREWEMLAT